MFSFPFGVEKGFGGYRIRLDHNYLDLLKAYIHLGVEFSILDRLVFCTPNIEKTSREKSSFEFPPNF